MVVVAGPDKGRRATLSDQPLTVGRGVGQSLQLSDGAVSRHHLTLGLHSSADGRVRVQLAELRGVNPVWTLLGGHRTNLAVGATLEIGSTLTLGNTTLIVEALVEEDAPSASNTIEIDARLGQGPRAPSRLAALASLGDRLARCGSLQAVYREATQWALAALPASRALILSPDGSDVLSASSEGTVIDLAVSKALLDRVARETKAFWVRDVLSEPDLADRKSVLLRGIVGAMASPSAGLVFYVEWGAQEALARRHDDEALLLLVCAAHLISAFGQGASERSQLQAATRARPRNGSIDVPRIIGRSAAISRLQVFVERVAPTPATVLLRGESGTGKELAAALLHVMSGVAQGPFVAINCAAIPEQLLESELFGHEKGAFTGAVTQHEGVFTRADGGTLFLDEIGEMSLSTQARMLRVLETRTFTPVGGVKEVKVSVRLIAATHRDLTAMVSEGSFRQDLLYRLSVIHTQLAPLRERVDDIELLVRHFAESLGEAMGRRIDDIAPDALAALQRYPWPGNVRELRNTVERALVLGDGGTLQVDDLPPEMLHAAPSGSAAITRGPSVTAGTIRPLAELEREAIDAALEATGGNKARAAALLGIDRTTLYRKLKDHK